jgi:protein-S-isoprenylcysteine O-methyltransferase Ste14
MMSDEVLVVLNAAWGSPRPSALTPPRAVQVVMSVPLLVIGTALGAMLGLALDRRRGADVLTHQATRIFVILGLCACALAVGLFLWGTGLLATPR